MEAKDVLKRYVEDELPEFLDIPLSDVNQCGHSGDTPLHVACIRGDIEEVIALLNAGAQVNATGDLGNTSLHYAVGQGHEEIVKKLLAKSANQKIKNDFNETARDIAVKLGHVALLQLMGRRGRP